MSAVKRTLTARWFISLIGVALLSLLIWFVGPLIAIADVRPLDSEWTRLAVIGGIFLLWAIFVFIGWLRARKANQQLAASIASAASAGDSESRATAEEVAVLQERLQESLDKLKKAKLGGGKGNYLYQLPWYILIGPPGAGKTTALVNSGLKFPLANELGKDPVRGVGGTRNCDWWFTDEAVLLDTAGRYTTQDSRQTVDAAGWTGFLGMLKKTRPRQPINGVLVAISLSDLLTFSESERLTHARAIRQRINELHQQLGVRFPIYVLFTKADLIAGFMEFFDDLAREDREQVWGMTLPLDEGKNEGGAVADFDKEFDLLLERANNRMIERIHAEPDIQRRNLIFGFPAQIAGLKEPASQFLTEIFRPNRFEERPLLRGVYFTSGTQEGTPIDRIMGAMAATFGLERQRLASLSNTGRSYFLTRLLRGVVFPEASVVSINRREERRRIWTQRIALAASLLIVLGMSAVWANSYLKNLRLIEDAEAQVERYRQQTAGMDLMRVSDADLPRMLEPLNTLRTLPAGYVHKDESAPIDMTFGLYQGEKIESQAVPTYRRALNILFLPRLLVRLEQQLAANINNADFLYEGLKVYLILGAQGPMDKELIRQWMRLDWERTFPGQQNEAGRQALSAHLDALLETPLLAIPLNGPLIDQARRTLALFPLAQRSYKFLRQNATARSLPEWRASEAAGPAASRVFVRTSGKQLSEGIPGLYTYSGFHDVFLPALDEVAREVAQEAWVLGQPTADAKMTDEQVARLKRDVLQLYLADYAKFWDGLLGDVAIAPFQGQADAAEKLMILSAPNSPLRNLLTSIATETKLTAVRASDAAAEKAGEQALKEGANVINRLTSQRTATQRLSNIVGAALAGTPGEPPPPPPGKFVEDRFKPLHELVERAADGSSGLDRTIKTMENLYRQLVNLGNSSAPGSATLSSLATSGGGTPAQVLRMEAARLPEPVASWVNTVAQAGSAASVSGAKADLNSDWQANVLPFCRKATENRYPIVRTSNVGMTLDDFSRLFGPGGLIDEFFTKRLVPLVDTSTTPWRAQRVDNVDLNIPPATLAQFQRAAAIRDALFASGKTPQVKFEIAPVSLDSEATQVLLEIDGQTLTYNHGPTRPVQMQWPGSGAGQARVTFTPQQPGSTVSEDGPWAFFRLLDKASVSRGSLSDRFSVTFNAGGRSARFDVRANSVNNPFTMRELEQFRCPASL